MMSEPKNNFDCAVCGSANIDFKFYGIGECNHPICGICAIKLSKFSKDSENHPENLYDYSKCVICKQHVSKIVISSVINTFDYFNNKNMISIEQYGLLFDGDSAYRFYQNVVKINCRKCQKEFDNVADLVAHVEVHKLRYCNLCVQFNKWLPSEFDLMSDNDYHYHNNKQHPKCKFCMERYYDDANLLKHVKERHFLCDICHRRQGFVAYDTQSELLKHYAKDHHVCEICRNAGNINAFDTEYNLKTHKVLEHDNKGLVTEGLVNINYGDTGARYGSRRRARENEDAPFEDVPVANNQPLPEMACVQEFPPLNAEPQAPNRQLGVRSTTNDENDARSAFVKNENHQDEPKKQVPTVRPKEAMSANVAYSMKKSIGRLNENDFPSLSGDVKVQNSSHLEYTRINNAPINKESSVPKKKVNIDEDFPVLAGGRGTNSSKTTQWKPTKSNATAPSQRPVQQYAPRVREPSPDNSPEVDMERERELAYQPKIQFMDEDQFKQNSSAKHKCGPQTMPPPKDGDFPALGHSKNNSGSGTKVVCGAWGEYSVPTQKPKAKEPKFTSFTSNGATDFPELPFKPKPMNNVLSNQKQKTKLKKKDNVACAAASANEDKTKVYSLKGLSNSLQREVAPKAEPVEASYRAPVSSSLSMRGIDYVPHVVPTNENVVLVDSKMFADLKTPKVASANAGDRDLSKNYEADFPSVGGGGVRAHGGGSNHFGVLRETEMCLSELETERRPLAKEEPKHVPKLSSSADFPSLGPSRPVYADKRPQYKERPQRERKAEETRPSMSLADIALSVTNKSYTPFTDTDARNQALFEAVHAALDDPRGQEEEAPLALKFLALANMYRLRKITVQAYLAAVTDMCQGPLVRALLPQMLVLLPDIALQKCLLSHLDPGWTVSLCECVRCGQIVAREDLEAHQVVAHS